MSETLNALLRDIAARPHDFDYFQALRRIDAVSIDHPRLGQSSAPAQDAVRLGQEPALTFAPRSLARVVGLEQSDIKSNSQPPVRLDSYMFGLFGPNGPLPLHLTEYAFSRLHNSHDPTFARFADIFHHRMASLFFRAWAEGEPVVSRDRPDEDRFGSQLAALAGFGTSELRDRDAMPDLAKLHFVGRLASHTRNPGGLQAILSSFFETPVTIEEFIPTWIRLPEAALCLLGRDPSTGTLGSTLTAGARIQVYHHRFRIVVGALNFAAYERLLPGQPGLEKLVPIVRNYIGEELDFELNLILRYDEVPQIRLGESGRLGWTTWIGKRPHGVDARDFTTTADATRKQTPRSA